MNQMFAVANSAHWWSFLSRSWESLTVIQWAAIGATAILTFGVVVEYWAKIKLLSVLGLKYLLGRSKPFDRCIFRKVLVHSIGPILVVLGIAGEVVFEGRAFVLEDKQEEQARTVIGSLQDQERTASNEAEALKKRLNIASTQMGTLEKEIVAQGPRAKLLVSAAPEIAKQLSPFVGQRVGLYVCGQLGVTEQETIDAWGAIANILGTDTIAGVTGAKWTITNPNLNFARNCGAAKGLGQGALVFVSKKAFKRTMDAANALAHELAKALPPSADKNPHLIDPEFAKLTVDRGFQAKNAAWTIVGYEPDLITVMFGEHP